MELIEKQQAIDAICAICGNDCDKSEFVYNAPQDEQVIMCPEHYVLSTLQSAQPEIIRCKDCQHSEYDAMYGDRYCHHNGKAEIVPDNHYCGYSERRTDG